MSLPALHGVAVGRLDRFRQSRRKAEARELGSPEIVVREQFHAFQFRQLAAQRDDAVEVLRAARCGEGSSGSG